MRNSPVQLRSASVDDAEAVAEIYNLEVTTGTNVFDIEPRTIDQQREWLTERTGAHAVVVATADDGEVTGFGSLSRYKERPSYATSVESSVYVARTHRGEGVGLALLNELVRVATDHGFHTMVARIEASNEASIALHRRAGFDVIGIEREIGRKFGRWLDICAMQRML